MSSRVFSRLCMWIVLLASAVGGVSASRSSGKAVQAVSRPAAPAAAHPRPNILLIVSDDQRSDTMAYMPRTRARIFDEGVTFSNAFVTTPLCCPSRASILTGRYAHDHGVLVNPTLLEVPTIAQALHAAGYVTGLVGKYLNSSDGIRRPEFDSWVAHRGGAVSYTDPFLNVNGRWAKRPGYVTHVLRDYAQAFLQQAALQEKPFFLLFTPNAPHEPAPPAPGDETLYAELPPHRPPSFNEEDVSDKPKVIWENPPLSDEQIANVDAVRRSQLQSLAALDQAVDSLLTTLESQGKLDNTVVIYISDNGYFWGEHRLTHKVMPYDEATRVPFVMRYPPLARPGQEQEQLVANVDIAPTLYELAGLPVPAEVDGRSLVPLLDGTAPVWRDELLIEGGYDEPGVFYQAVRTDRYLYIETEGQKTELYDLASDPFQMTNRIFDSAYAGARWDMRSRLTRARASIPPFVHIRGPAVVVQGEWALFTARARGLDATMPLTFTWRTDGMAPAVHVRTSLTDWTWLRWPDKLGVQAVRLHVTDAGGRIVESSRVLIVRGATSTAPAPVGITDEEESAP